MSKNTDYNALATNPQVRQFLDVLASSEGTAGTGDNGYNVGFGGGQFASYADHPRTQKSFTQTDGVQNTTSAAGRYQFLGSTWDDVAKALKLKDFSPKSQDKAAIELIRRGGALDNVLTGDFQGAINKLGSTWASLPSSPYAQPKKTMNDLLGNGTMPAQTVNRNGQQMVAVPETASERESMVAFDRAGHDDSTQAMLTNALSKVTEARNSLVSGAPMFDMYPSDLDNQLLELIDRA
jgi:muramidase (phage lysozyme)